MQIYSDKVFEYFRKPKNMGEIKNPDGVATIGNPVCGDVMKLFIKVRSNKITAIKFQTLGCAAAMATSSMVTEMVKGKSLKVAKNLKETRVIRALGGLPKQKIHCSVLAVRALKEAIKDYENKKKKTERREKKDNG